MQKKMAKLDPAKEVLIIKWAARDWFFTDKVKFLTWSKHKSEKGRIQVEKDSVNRLCNFILSVFASTRTKKESIMSSFAIWTITMIASKKSSLLLASILLIAA